MEIDKKEKIVEVGLKAGLGAISQVSEYAAEGMKNPKAVQISHNFTNALKENNKVSEAGANIVKWAATGAAGLASTAGATGAGATVVAALPVVAIASVAGLAAYGLYKLGEKYLDN